MKKKTIFLLTILLMAISVTSCSSDDDNEKTEFTSTLTVNGSSVKITNLEGKVSAGFEFWINDATSDFYIQGTTDHRAELATGKDVTKDCKILIGLVKREEWYSSEKEYVSGTIAIEKWDLENFRVTLVFKDYKCKSGSKSIVLNGSVTFPTSINI